MDERLSKKLKKLSSKSTYKQLKEFERFLRNNFVTLDEHKLFQLGRLKGAHEVAER